MTELTAEAAAGAPRRDADPLLHGTQLFVGILVLGLVTFLVCLDLTIVNVILPSVAASFGAAPHEVTMGITVFAAAQAVIMPLTGWLTGRLGIVRLFILALIGFAATSILCGMAPTLEAFLLGRVLQGLSCGPLLPLVQTLIQRSTPKAKLPAAFAFWTATLSLGPLVGPALGGTMADSIGWSWGFYINAPIAIGCIFVVWRVFGVKETTPVKSPIDLVGLALLVVWVGSLQFVADKGHELQWFASPLILGLTVLGIVCLISFLIWEFSDARPLVDFSVWRYRSFWVGAPISALSFSSSTVATLMQALWLQLALGYTPTWAGYAIGAQGIGAITAGVIASVVQKTLGPRGMVCFGMSMSCALLIWRTNFSIETDFALIALAQLLVGFSSTTAMVPLFSLTMSDIPEKRLAAAAGMLTFVRMLSLGGCTAFMMTLWQNGQSRAHDLIADGFNLGGRGIDSIIGGPLASEQTLAIWNAIADRESLTLATNEVLWALAACTIVGPVLIWLCPRPKAQLAAGPSAPEI